MKTSKIAAAAVVALLVGAGSAAAYSGNFVQDTPSLAFRNHQGSVTQGGGANLVIPGTATPRVFAPVRGYSVPLPQPLDSSDRNPSQEFDY